MKPIPKAKRKHIYLKAAASASYNTFFHYWGEILKKHAGLTGLVTTEQFAKSYPEFKLFQGVDIEFMPSADINEIRITALCLCAAMCK
jgi:hypothetical protein